MKYLLIACAITLFFIGCQASMSLQYPKNNSITNVHAGNGYLDSCKAALQSSYLACQWSDDYSGVDDEGAAYKEGQAAAEDADCHEDKDDETN